MLLRLVPLVFAASLAFAQTPNKLTEAETRQGWLLIFDGRTLDGWTWGAAKQGSVPGWTVRDGALITTPGQGKPGDLLSRDSFKDFELSFDWNVGPGANSGVKYRIQAYWAGSGPGSGFNVQSDPKSDVIVPIGLEYQITDDETNSDALSDEKHSASALYEYWAPKKAGPARANAWHSGRIVVRGLHVEHWLDGRKAVDVDLDSENAREAFGKSQRRSSSALLKQARRETPIALQFHDGVVSFRNLKIRRF